MFFSKRSSLGRIALALFSLTIFLVACDLGTQTVTPTPQASRTLSPGNGGGTGRIAFTCLLPSHSTTTICISALDGSGLQQFTHLPAGACCPQWSPDGRRLAFSVISGPPLNRSDIWAMNADGSGLVNLTHAPQQDNLEPSWSPDGKQIVFIANVDNAPELYLMNVDGLQKRSLLVGMRTESPMWSPDGRKIAFASQINDTLSAINIMNPDGSGTKEVIHAPGYYGSLVWSPDSKRLLYAYTTYASVSSQTTSQSDVYVMKVDGSGQVQFTSSPTGFYSSFPTSWSPDGTKILFWRNHSFGPNLQSSQGAIWIMNADGSGQTQLTLQTQAEGGAIWQP